MASVDKDPTRARTPWVVRWRDETGRQRKRGFGKKSDADRFRAEVEHQLHSGTYVDVAAGATTFAAFYADFAARQVWAPKTVINAGLAAGSVTFGGVPLRQLRRSHIEGWVKALQVRGLAPTTIRTHVAIVRSVLRGAVRDRIIGADPSEGVTLPRQRRAEVAMEIPTPAQVRAGLEAMPDRLRALMALCAFAGLRLGEACAVQQGDVDFLRRELRVARQVQRVGGVQTVRPPKYGSERTVYLAPDLVTMLARHVERYGAGEDGWLFRAGSGRPVNQNDVGNHWRRVDCGRPHDLRHFYASGLIAAGCDVVTVQRALGHHSAAVTLRVYSHLWPSAEDRTRAAATAIMADVLADVPTMRPSSAG